MVIDLTFQNPWSIVIVEFSKMIEEENPESFCPLLGQISWHRYGFDHCRLDFRM